LLDEAAKLGITPEQVADMITDASITDREASAS
jgi:hypothetical protein